MILSTAVPLLLLPFVAANGVHRMKLKKLPAIAHEDHSLAIAQLSRKYGAQQPLVGAGGLGRKLRPDGLVNEGRPRDDLYWTQSVEQANGGHSLPLNSTSPSRFDQWFN